MNQLFIDKLHEAKTARNARLLEAVEQMYIVCEQKAELESEFGDKAKKFGKAALVAGTILGGSHLAGQTLKSGMENRAREFTEHEIACGGMMDEADLDKPLNYSVDGFGVDEVVRDAKLLEIDLRKTRLVGGVVIANEISELVRAIEDGDVDEATHKQLNAKMEQGRKFVEASKTEVCKDGKPF